MYVCMYAGRVGHFRTIQPPIPFACLIGGNVIQLENPVVAHCELGRGH